MILVFNTTWFLFMAATAAAYPAEALSGWAGTSSSQRQAGEPNHRPPLATPRSLAPVSLPKPPDGVTHLEFRDLLVTPIGARGLEMTPLAKSLAGKKVRMLGFMAQQDEPAPGRFLFNPFPMTLHEEEYGFAEDLPPTCVYVFMPEHARGEPVPFTPGPLLLTGTLDLGNRQEVDTRISAFRLYLDDPTRSETTADLSKPSAQIENLDREPDRVAPPSVGARAEGPELTAEYGAGKEAAVE